MAAALCLPASSPRGIIRCRRGSEAEPGCDGRCWLQDTSLGNSPEGRAVCRRQWWHVWLPCCPQESPGVKVEAEMAAPNPVIRGWGEVEVVPSYTLQESTITKSLL